MFGLYPAGSNWVRHFNATASARVLQHDLASYARFTAGIFFEPFGVNRGAVIAQRDCCLVLADAINAEAPEIVVVPDVEMQNLLWSFNSGYANQWSDRELKALTGCGNWDQVIKQASAQFAKVCDDVEKCIAGEFAKASTPAAANPDPAVPLAFYNDDDAPVLPSDYLFDSPLPEVP